MDANARRRRVRSYLIQALWWATTFGDNDACLEGLMEQPDLDETVGFAAVLKKKKRPPYLASATHADTGQGSPDQPLAGTSHSEVAAATRLWS